MSTLALTLKQRRCENHQQREASARCPECSLFYCRECITEHEDRVLCANCLAKVTVKKTSRKVWAAWIPRLSLAVLAVVLIYFCFLLFGTLILSFPSHFHHEGGW